MDEEKSVVRQIITVTHYHAMISKSDLKAVPLFKFSIEDAVGKAFSADPDAFQHTVAAQLVQHYECFHDPCAEQVSNMSLVRLV